MRRYKTRIHQCQISRQDIADYLGVSESTVNRWASTGDIPGAMVDRLDRLLEALGSALCPVIEYDKESYQHTEKLVDLLIDRGYSVSLTRK